MSLGSNKADDNVIIDTIDENHLDKYSITSRFLSLVLITKLIHFFCLAVIEECKIIELF